MRMTIEMIVGGARNITAASRSEGNDAWLRVASRNPKLTY